MSPRPQLLFQVMIKCHQSVRLIPSELMDAPLRKILACFSYQILRLSFESQEDELIKRFMVSELPINARKWRKYV